MSDVPVAVPDPPAIPGLVFRRFRGPDDFPGMAEVSDAHHAARGVPTVTTIEDMANYYAHLHNCDPATDMVCADVDGRFVAYSRVTWWDEARAPNRIYLMFGWVHPQWQRRGIGAALLGWNEARVREIAAGHATDRQQVVESFADDPGGQALLAAHGFEVRGHSVDMVRPHFDDIPAAHLPEELEVRPVRPEHMRAIWEADAEAFADHPGDRVQGEDDYEAFLGYPHNQPHLWRVAWDGDQVVGQVRTLVNHSENARLGRRRGYTEFISVRAPWRRRGVARALLVDSLRALRDEGMDSAALGVYVQNPRGALRLYESVGFETVATTYEHRKPLVAP